MAKLHAAAEVAAGRPWGRARFREVGGRRVVAGHQDSSSMACRGGCRLGATPNPRAYGGVG